MRRRVASIACWSGQRNRRRRPSVSRLARASARPWPVVAQRLGGGGLGRGAAKDRGEDLPGLGGTTPAVAGVRRLTHHTGPVLVAAAGHAHVEVLGAGGGVGEEDGPI